MTPLSRERKRCILHQEEAFLGARIIRYIVCELRGGSRFASKAEII